MAEVDMTGPAPIPSAGQASAGTEAYWRLESKALFLLLQTGEDGLSASEAAARRAGSAPAVAERPAALRLFLRQFASPLMLILVFAALLAALMGERLNTAIIAAILFGSAFLGFSQEYRASAAIAKLRQRLRLTATLLRGGEAAEIPVEEIVPGDLLLLSAGDLVPADGVVLEAKDLLVSEAALTGETFPVEKRPGIVPPRASLSQRSNCVFQGTSVRSGTGKVLIARTGSATEYGRIGARLAASLPETEFAAGLRRFGFMLTRIMLIIVILVLVANLALGRPLADTLLFAVALAVGLSPELLPAIVSVTLATGARAMARSGVIVRRLEAIENLGSMTVLCTDKTGTLTVGIASLDAAIDTAGRAAPEVLRLAYLNAALESGIDNPLDAAIVKAGEAAGLDIAPWRKIDEIPYDFVRRRLTIVVATPDGTQPHRLITKGAVEPVLACCGSLGLAEPRPLDAAARGGLLALFRQKSAEGYRVLGLAVKQMAPAGPYDCEDERDLCFAGFLLIRDPAKPDAARTVQELRRLGVKTKVLTGDNRFIAASLAREVGLDPDAMLTGEQIGQLSDAGLWQRARRSQLFAEVDPQQKERIIRVLRRGGEAVGFLGDGINDAPALHAADIGISVQGAVDVARESADIVLLRSDLGVLRQGIEDGRRTFINTQKYIAITMSANFGNMISMAVASLALPFLPLLAKQILLNNFLSDIPSLAISTDNVDPEVVRHPPRWRVRELKHFMLYFGLISSLFDAAAFALLLLVFHTGEAMFQTGWFVLSLMTELAVVLVLRTHRPALNSRPGRLLLWLTLAVMLIAVLIPYGGGIAAIMGFVPLPGHLLAGLGAILAGYVLLNELAKQRFYRRHAGRRPRRG